ncbi:MAG: hypothetical protein HC938_16560, partial [Nitrospira sp.]|nr:hypothetical protein [Nitrospira sp.]
MSPERCYLPAQLLQGARWWGIALQLYSMRSDRNWGVGDFGDLAPVVEWAGRQLGAAFIGLNPLHALKNTTPYHISPYSPTSRLFLNDLYIDLEQVAEYRTAPEMNTRLADPSFVRGSTRSNEENWSSTMRSRRSNVRCLSSAIGRFSENILTVMSRYCSRRRSVGGPSIDLPSRKENRSP